jgi:hypothetical protein
MEVEIGRITHYYNHLNVAVLKLTDSLKLVTGSTSLGT